MLMHGQKGILELGDIRGFTPTPLQSIVSSKDGDIIQVVTGWYSGGAYRGVYYKASADGGSIWSIPALISDAGSFFRNFNEIAVDSV